MTMHQRIFAFILAMGLFIFIVDLVRRRKLQEEYAMLWLIAGASIAVLSICYPLVVLITRIIGAAAPMSTLFFLGLFFLISINIHYSVKISRLSKRIKDQAQELALLRHDLEKGAGR